MLERCFELFGVKIYYLKKNVPVCVCVCVCVCNAVTFSIFIQSFSDSA